MPAQMRVRVLGSKNGLRAAFVRSLALDLREATVPARLFVRSGRFHLWADPPDEHHPDRLVQIAKRIRKNQLTGQKNLLQNIRDRYGTTLLRPDPVDPATVRPELALCVTREDFRLFTYCRLLQTIPTSPLVGRRMSWLVFDVAVEPRRLLGAFGLNSSPFSLGARDRYLGWSPSNAIAAKERGLLCLMDMPLCMALRPYAELRGAKLVAALALTDEVNQRYTERYKGRLPKNGGLLGVVTLCATGVHCPIYNRIMLRPGGLYRRIGLTRGFSTAFVSDATLALARQVVQTFGYGLKPGLFAKSMRLVKRALELSGVPGEPLLHTGVHKGIYFGTGDTHAAQMLRTGIYGAISRPTVAAAIESWTSALEKRQLLADVGFGAGGS